MIYLVYVFLHAEPILVADIDATVAPLVVIGSLGRIQQSFLGMLQANKENILDMEVMLYVHVVSHKYICNNQTPKKHKFVCHSSMMISAHLT